MLVHSGIFSYLQENYDPLTQWREIPVQDRFDQRILADTGSTRGCVQNSLYDSSWTI